MPSPMSFLDPNNPQVIALMQRNPNGVMAMLIRNGQKKGTIASTPSGIVGGNNAGGGTFNGVGTTANGPSSLSFGNPQGMGGSLGTFSNGNQRNAFPGGSSLGVGATGNNNGSFMGGSPVSFAAGGMMTEQGTAVRPGMPMPPSAGTGRTLPSARFKVDAQMPQGGPAQPPMMPPQGGPALGATGPAPMDPAQIEQEAQAFVQQHPEEAQKVQAVIAMAIQSGELTQQELNMAVQLAKTALANPSAYPQIREFAIKNGLGTEQDVPPQMDQGLLYVLIVAGKSAQAAAPGAASGNAMTGQGPSAQVEVPEYKDGGMTGDRPHLAKVHPREYVIPEDTLIYHGKKHFDKLVEQARTPPDANKAN